MNREEIGKLADIVIQDMRISEALAKQKPMKPTPYKKTIGICKSCEDFVNRWDNYCPSCGQNLDWSEE